MKVFTAALSVISQANELSTCPSTGEEIEQIISSVVYSNSGMLLAIKRNTLMIQMLT